MEKNEMISKFDYQISKRLKWIEDSYICGRYDEDAKKFRNGLYREITAILDMAFELELLNFEEWENCYDTLYGECENLEDKEIKIYPKKGHSSIERG